MTITQPPATLPSEPDSRHRLTPAAWMAAAFLLVAVLAGVTGYLLGSHKYTSEHVLVGRAFVMPNSASVKVDGWVYSVAISPDMLWYDTKGVVHDGGTPPCLKYTPYYLNHGHHAWIRFGWTTAHGLVGDSWRSVDWVQCVPSPGFR